MNLDDLRKKIQNGDIRSQPLATIASGKLESKDGQFIEYSIHEGWNIISATECDKFWVKAQMELFDFIVQQNFDPSTLEEVLDSVQAEDLHWDWLKKSCAYVNDEYRWFYLYAGGKPQGACLIFHPKDSALETAKIFYVEYIAVAPWNRSCKIRQREFKGVGSILLQASLRFAIDTLGLTPGFSLHSLPKAKEYYKKIKMVNIPKYDKKNLMYFELPQENATELMKLA